jgi:hypothetical protein
MVDTPNTFVTPGRLELRRSFLKQAAALALATPAALTVELPTLLAADSKQKHPETLVSILYDTLTEKQKNEVCFSWDHVDKTRGLLRTRIENNWKITKPSIKSSFFTAEQQQLALDIFRGMTHPDWHSRFDKQLKDDVGGFGNNQ